MFVSLSPILCAEHEDEELEADSSPSQGRTGGRHSTRGASSKTAAKDSTHYTLAEARLHDLSRGYQSELSRFRQRTRSMTGSGKATASAGGAGAAAGKPATRKASKPVVEYGLDGRPIVKRAARVGRPQVVVSPVQTSFFLSYCYCKERPA